MTKEDEGVYKFVIELKDTEYYTSFRKTTTKWQFEIVFNEINDTIFGKESAGGNGRGNMSSEIYWVDESDSSYIFPTIFDDRMNDI